MANSRSRILTSAACLVLLALAACGRGREQMHWAQAALERNGAIEIVAVDERNHTFTIRVKDSGELRVVRADQVVGEAQLTPAAPSGPAAAPPSAAAGAAASAAAGAAAVATTPAAATSPAAASAPAGEDAAPGEPATAAAAEAAAPQVAQPGAQPASLAPQNAPSIEAAPGRVLKSGPGYTIKVADGSAADSARLRDASVTSAAVEWRHEPIVCQGARLVHIDNRNLVFDGDAVSAEDGCEIHITNSRIVAAGVGVSARAANVHIDNSLIEGDQASIDASEGAQVYAASSHFHGLSRRLDTAAFHDLGGNVWN